MSDKGVMSFLEFAEVKAMPFRDFLDMQEVATCKALETEAWSEAIKADGEKGKAQ